MTRKEFREYLNQKFPFNPNENNKRGDKGQYGQRKRAYGDYLWHQDREFFENDYQDYLKGVGL